MHCHQEIIVRASIEKELAQAQARYRKLKTDHEMLLSKYGKRW